MEELTKKVEKAAPNKGRKRKSQPELWKRNKLKEKRETERWEADRLRRRKLNEELKSLHEQTVSEDVKRQHGVHTLHTWQMLNRVKNEEVNEEYKEMKKEEKRKRILKYRAELIAQWNERKELDAKELAERRYFYGEKALRALKNTDKQFLDYASQIIEECIAKGLQLFPIEKVINDYKNKYRLNSKPEKTNSSNKLVMAASPLELEPGPTDVVRNRPVRKSVQCKLVAPSLLPERSTSSNLEYQPRKSAKK